MKTFKEDKERSDSFPRKENGLTDPAYMEQLEKLENSESNQKYKEYISDAMMTYNLNNHLSSTKAAKAKNVQSLFTQGTGSEYSGESPIKKTIDSSQPQEKKEVIEKDAKMELSINSCVEIDLFFSYVKYEINIYDREKHANLKVYRRYCEFENLRKILVNKYACVYAPPLPGKIGLFSRENRKKLIEKRKKFLQIFLHELQFLVYYFYDSPEIRDFLDPNIEYFSYNEVLCLNNLLTLDVDESIIHLKCYAEIAKRSFVRNIQNIHDKIVLKLREPDMSMTDKLTEIVIKNYPRKIIQKNRNHLMKFANDIKNHQAFIHKVFEVLEDLKEKEKKYVKIENNFNKKFIEFQKEYMENLNFEEEEAPMMDFERVKEKVNQIYSEKPLYVLTKNISDYIYREENIIQAYLDSFLSLNYFIKKDKEVRMEIQRIKSSKRKIKRKEELNKLLKLNHFLNKILILNTIYLHDVRIDRYKYSRFRLYYNAVRFVIEKNKEYIYLQNQLLQQMSNQVLSTQIINVDDLG